MAKVHIDTGECIGCGACVDLCPAVFMLNDATVCELRSDDVDDPQCVQEAIDTCPVECLHWE